jgi:DNA-binding transcriptional regulator YdaS (Cro superfamily)
MSRYSPQFHDFVKVYGCRRLARELGVSAQAVSLWSRGRYPVPIKHCLRISAISALPLSALRPDHFKENDECSNNDWLN